MTDVRVVELSTIEGPFFDWILRKVGVATLDEREELATAVRVALGTDSLADSVDVLPDPDSADRRGWWGDLEAELIWGGWPIGTKSWLLTRAKITESPSSEGSTLQRAKQYTSQALQPLIDKRIATRVDVDAVRTELNRIEVRTIIYRGPKAEIDLRYQLLWEEEAVVEDVPATIVPGVKIRIPYRNAVLSSPAPSAVVNYKNIVVPSGDIRLSPVAPSLIAGLFIVPSGNVALSQDAPSSLIRSTTIPQGNLVASRTPPVISGGIDAFTKLMLHFDGTDGSTTFTDSSSSAHYVARIGDTQIDTAQSKFGGASCLFDGSGDALQLDGSSDFAFGSGDWTIDFWLRLASVAGSQMIYDGRPLSTQGAYPTLYSSAGVLVFHVNSTNVITAGTTLSVNTWYHVAVVRSGTSTKLFIGGTQSGSTYTDSTTYLNPAGRPAIGIQSYDMVGAPLNGWLDEFRVSKGIARWTTTFTPPTNPYF